MANINKIIELKVSGKFAHFRKFYTNSSSLSYLIPPRTAIIGMFASILERERDTYYEEFESIYVSLSIPEGWFIRKQTHSINNLHNAYYRLLVNGNGKIQHSQNKLELLLFPVLKKKIVYNIYIGIRNDSDDKIVKEIVSKVKDGNLGYGAYLGQRQFKAFIELVNVYEGTKIKFLDSYHTLHSICSEENFVKFELEEGISIIRELMPHDFKTIENKNEKSREPVSVRYVYFEKTGKPLKGEFKNCYQIGENVISFY